MRVEREIVVEVFYDTPSWTYAYVELYLLKSSTADTIPSIYVVYIYTLL